MVVWEGVRLSVGVWRHVLWEGAFGGLPPPEEEATGDHDDYYYSVSCLPT